MHEGLGVDVLIVLDEVQAALEGLEHHAPARKLITAGVPVALATDFNPGTCYTMNMQIILAFACQKMQMSPAETITAATVNGAYSLGLSERLGTLEEGKQADIVLMGVSDYRELPYLLYDVAISYAHSATFLYDTMNRERAATGKDYIAFAPLFSQRERSGYHSDTSRHLRYNSSGNRTLSASQAEVEGIADLFLARASFTDRWFSSKIRIYLQKEAHEKRVKSPELQDYRYVHFATHGVLDETMPQLSGLLLAPGISEDGILYLNEIFGLRLNAEMVVLSACETGSGKYARGEGLVGLTRGFLYAGAASLLVSLWQVADASTADLMVDFYTNRLSGMSPASALQSSKVSQIRKNYKFARPYYWAPFVYIGG